MSREAHENNNLDQVNRRNGTKSDFDTVRLKRMSFVLTSPDGGSFILASAFPYRKAYLFRLISLLLV